MELRDASTRQVITVQQTESGNASGCAAVFRGVSGNVTFRITSLTGGAGR